GVKSMLIEMHRKAFGRFADDHRLHTRQDWATAELFRDAKAFDQLALAFGRAAAVTAHRRHDKRQRVERAHVIANCLDNDVNVRDATTAGSDRHALAWLNGIA